MGANAGALRASNGACACAGAEASSAYDWDKVNNAVLETYQRLVRQKAGTARV